jgi:hypothetical protein
MFSKAANTKPTLQSSVREVYRINSGTGTFARITPQSANVLSLSIDLGKAQLYLLRRPTKLGVAEVRSEEYPS